MPSPTPRKILLLSLLGHLAWFGAGVRHRFVYGGDWYQLLHGLEAAALALGAILCGWAWWQVVRHHAQLPQRFVWLGGLALTAIAWGAPPFTSTDVFDYVARGHVAVLGENPYVTTLRDLADRPGMDAYAGAADWHDHVMPYGPIAYGLQWCVAQVADLGGGPWVGAYLWKALMALVHIGTALVLARTVGAVALAAWLWNPWLLLEVVGAGHNDGFIALGLACMAFALLRGNTAGGIFSWSAGAMVKHGALVFAPVLFLDAVKRRQLVPMLGASLVVAGVLAASWWLLWNVPGGLDWLTAQGSVQNASLANLVRAATDLDPSRVFFGVGAVLVLGLLGRAWLVGNTPRSTLAHGALASVVFVLLCMPAFQPWYHLWWLPVGVAACGVKGPMGTALALWTIAGPISYMVMAATHTYGLMHQTCQVLIAGVVPALPLLLGWRKVLLLAEEVSADAAEPTA